MHSICFLEFNLASQMQHKLHLIWSEYAKGIFPFLMHHVATTVISNTLVYSDVNKQNYLFQLSFYKPYVLFMQQYSIHIGFLAYSPALCILIYTWSLVWMETGDKYPAKDNWLIRKIKTNFSTARRNVVFCQTHFLIHRANDKDSGCRQILCWPNFSCRLCLWQNYIEQGQGTC